MTATPIIKPKALRGGDAIGVVAPAGPVNRERMERALARVEKRGFRMKTYGDVFRSRGYLAGDDATRAAELMAAFEDLETSAVWCARGGYGVVRILDRLDFEAIRRHPKVFVGFSDITLLHVAIQQRCGFITFHGPNLQDGFGKDEDMPAANEAALWRAVMQADDAEKLLTAESRSASAAELSVVSRLPNQEGYEYKISEVQGAELRTIAGGMATGRLIGGNLAVLCGVVGTPYELEPAGRILFLEDLSERLYRIDRYLSQLTLAGNLSQVAGILLGNFSYEEGDHKEAQSDLLALFEEYLAPLGVPMLAGFPAGHERYNLTLPMGALVELDAENKQLVVRETTTTI